MSDNMGVLATLTTTTLGTTTAYTCPAGKAAKVRLQILIQSGAAGTTDFGILVNGCEVARTGVIAANNYLWTPASPGVLLNAASAAKPSGLAFAATTMRPADSIFYLSAGQTIQYSLFTQSPASINFQVVGIEIDLTA